MPRVKIDYIVSCSSEDPASPASNLLEKEISKKRWLCAKGESSCSAVLQLARFVRISSVQVGVHHSALVEVLVGRSETPDNFKVLVPSCIFISAMDSRKSENLERVRSFSTEHMLADVAQQKWDRIRVVCSQPYNRFCQFGLTFIQVYEPETMGSTPGVTAIPSRLVDLDMASSDEETTFKPGELFAKHSQSNGERELKKEEISNGLMKTAKEISNATESPKVQVKKTLEKKKEEKRINNTEVTQTSDRQRHSLLYDDEDNQPHTRIDKIVTKHQEEKTKKAKQESSKVPPKPEKRDDKRNSSMDKVPKTPQSRSRSRDKESGSSGKKRKRSPSKDDHSKHETKRLRAGPISLSPHTLLAGVVFVLSGYENPLRGTVRDQALAMGAKFERDWTSRCTHLICAYNNTPKLRTVRGLPNGDTFAVATAEWIEECCRLQRLLPWQWFATEPQRKIKRPSDDELDGENDAQPDSGNEIPNKTPESDCDTDDEIEKVLQKQRDAQPAGTFTDPLANSHHNASPHSTSDNHAESERDKPMKDRHSMESECSTIELDSNEIAESADDDAPSLPNFLEGLTFVVDESVEAAGFDVHQLRRYVYAYGGEVIQETHLNEDTEVSYVLCGGAAGVARARGPGRGRGRALRADWLWRCHERGRLCSVTDYLL